MMLCVFCVPNDNCGMLPGLASGFANHVVVLKKLAAPRLKVCMRFAWLCGCCVGVCHEEVYVGVELGAGKAPRVCV